MIRPVGETHRHAGYGEEHAEGEYRRADSNCDSNATSHEAYPTHCSYH